MSVGADNLGSGDLPRTSIIYFTPTKEQEVAFLVMRINSINESKILINMSVIWRAQA